MRIQYEGAIYHVMCRGDRRQAIFRDAQDRENFRHTLGEMCQRTGQRVHGYVLMGNHYHLLLETPEANLAAGMQWFQGVYTQRYNARHRLCGHLFQGRYKAIPVESEATEYLLAASEYIHLNLVRAGLLGDACSDLRSYPWSSFALFVGKEPLLPWLCRERIFGCLELVGDGAAARRRYGAWTATRVREARRPLAICRAP